MNIRYYLLVLFFPISMTYAQTTDSTGISYIVDTIAAPNCYQSKDGAILLEDVSIPGTIDRYEWSDGSDLEDLIFINGGTYQLTIYNTDGESFKTEEFFVPEPDTLVIQSFISPPTKNTTNDGFIDLTLSGGTGPYALTMIFNQDTMTVSSDSIYTIPQIDTGTYIFTVLDARGCTDTARYEVSQRPCELLVTALVEPAECINSPTGRIELLIENAVEPYSIEWADRTSSSSVLNNLPAGNYKFTIRDRRECVVRDSIEIIYEDRIPPQALIRDQILLYLDSDGKAEIRPQDILIGSRDECHNNLTYKFEKNAFTCNDVGLNEINFFVIDGVGNSAPFPVQIEIRDTSAVELIFQDTVYTALCNGIALYDPPKVQGSCATPSSGGVVKMTTREITAPGTYLDRYYYLRNPGDTLRANVTVIVADARVRSFLIVTEPECNKGEDGSIAVALRNSASPVSYLWDDGSTQDYIFGIRNQREYTVTVTEGNGCVFVLSAEIEGPESLSVQLQDVIEKENSVDIIPDVNGGNPPLEYAWYREGKVISESRNLLNVEDGNRYQLIVTDAKGCISDPLIVDRTMTPAARALGSQIDIFPNPNTGLSLSIRFRDDVGLYSAVRLINSRQQIVREVRNLNVEIHVPMDIYPPGMYFIQFIRNDGKVFSKKVIRL